MIKQTGILRVMVAHRRREVHDAIFISLIEAEAESLEVFIPECFDPADYVVIHVFRFLRSSFEEIRSLICAFSGFAFYSIQYELVLSFIVAASAGNTDDHPRLHFCKGFHLVRCEIPLDRLDVACSVGKSHVKMSLSVVAVTYIYRLNKVSVLYAMPFIRP